MKRMCRSLIPVLYILVAAICDGAAAQNPPEKFANQIKAYTDSANFEKEALAQMLGVAQDISEFAREDVKLITAYMEQAANTWNSAAAALQKGDEAGATALAKQAQALDKK